MKQDTLTIITIFSIWITSIFIVLFVAWKLLKERAQINLIKLNQKEKEIEKSVDNSDLSTLVDHNNDERSKS